MEPIDAIIDYFEASDIDYDVECSDRGEEFLLLEYNNPKGAHGRVAVTFHGPVTTVHVINLVNVSNSDKYGNYLKAFNQLNNERVYGKVYIGDDGGVCIRHAFSILDGTNLKSYAHHVTDLVFDMGDFADKVYLLYQIIENKIPV